MANTKHNHHIPGTSVIPLGKFVSPHRCGGIAHCGECAFEATAYNRVSEVPRNVDKDFQRDARQALIKYIDVEYPEIEPYEVYIVWFVKVLQHWKATMATNLPDNAYFELTYNGDKDEVYVDDYSKRKNTVIKL